MDHYHHGPYDMLLTLSKGRSIGLLRQGPTLPTSKIPSWVTQQVALLTSPATDKTFGNSLLSRSLTFLDFVQKPAKL